MSIEGRLRVACYLRVSTETQELDNQRTEILQGGTPCWSRLNCWRRLVIQSPEKKGRIVKPRASEFKQDPATGMSAMRLGSIVRHVHIGTLAFKQIQLESPDEARVPRSFIRIHEALAHPIRRARTR